MDPYAYPPQPSTSLMPSSSSSSSAAPPASPPVTPCRRRLPAKLLDTTHLDTAIFSPMYTHSTPDMSYARRPPIQPAGNATSSNLASSTTKTTTMVPYTPDAACSSYAPNTVCITPAAQLAPSYYNYNYNHNHNHNHHSHLSHGFHGTPTTSDVTNGRTPSPFAARFDDYISESNEYDNAHNINTINTISYENHTPLLSIDELAPPSPPLDDLLLSDSFVSKCNIDACIDKENRNPQNPANYAWSPLRIAADLRDGTHEAIAVAPFDRHNNNNTLPSLPSRNNISNNNNNNNNARTPLGERVPLADITNQFVDVSVAAENEDFLTLQDFQDEENSPSYLFGDTNNNNNTNTHHQESSLNNIISDVEDKLESKFRSGEGSKKKRTILPLKSSLRMMR